MRNRFIAVVLGVMLALGAMVALPADRADAHQFDNYSYFYCSKHRVDPGWTVTHSKPITLTATYVRYYCRQRLPSIGIEDQYWVIAGVPLSGGGSWQEALYQRCYPDGIIVCREP